MTAHDKAQAGWWMIEEAVTQVMSEEGDMQPSVVSKKLGLRWKFSDGSDHGNELTFQIIRIMTERSNGPLIKKGSGYHPTYGIKP